MLTGVVNFHKKTPGLRGHRWVIVSFLLFTRLM